MAKRYGKKDNFLTYVIIGFGVLIVGLSATLIYLNATAVTYEYDEFDHLTDFSQFATQAEERYAVYYYQVECAGCKAAKQDTLAFATENNLNMKVYLVNALQTTDTFGVKDLIQYEGADLRYTPTLLIYENGVIVDMIVGSELLIPFYNDVENGNY